MTKIDQIFNLTSALSSASLLMYAQHVYNYSAGGSLMVGLGGVIMCFLGISSLFEPENGDF